MVIVEKLVKMVKKDLKEREVEMEKLGTTVKEVFLVELELKASREPEENKANVESLE